MSAVSFRDLRVWNRAMDLAESIYRLTIAFPRSEQYGLVSQLRRASVSISANIAEGNGRGSRADYSRFVSIALGSAREVDSLLQLSIRVGLTKAESARESIQILEETCRMLNRLRQSLEVGS
ncbi:MAG: four helix bundle protein [Planctomycetales bacterium]|nr:MAG: four helix bundle protein [Planctomycetales bacterium]